MVLGYIKYLNLGTHRFNIARLGYINNYKQSNNKWEILKYKDVYNCKTIYWYQ